MIFLTSDTHWNHSKGFLYEPRGFKSIQEHDEQIIKNWNSVVSPDDTVYHLGDLGMGTDYEYLAACVKRLNGRIKWIFGNHDGDKKIEYLFRNCRNLDPYGYAEVIKDGKWQFYLSHFPTAVGNYDDEARHRKFYCLCGHSHTSDKWQDFRTMKSYHVELDAHHNTPVSLESIKQDIREVQ